MVKTKVTETIEKYDMNGKLVEKVIREEEREDDSNYSPAPLKYDIQSLKWNPGEPYCDNNSSILPEWLYRDNSSTVKGAELTKEKTFTSNSSSVESIGDSPVPDILVGHIQWK